ncbi:cyclin-dependent-like kinase 5 [Paramacrobiotus metropolitanus]|uniref:cyclin-dependent-like kinase 5 n=1 Tax=Paramacrobiotus metropolitanus TaxID=2943436 RepID=UPI002445C284|nr:cyclin-dependent-like kinase 5 [Paramacrobiotus metropolitanus]
MTSPDTVIERRGSAMEAPSFSRHFHYGAQDFVCMGRFTYIYKTRCANNTVAIRVVNYNGDTYEEAVRQCTRNFDNLKQFQHPNLIMYHDIRVSSTPIGAKIEFMTDYCPGLDLGRRIATLRNDAVILNAVTVLTYVEQIASGLSFLHERNFMHGVLSPATILIKRLNNAEDRLLIGSLENISPVSPTLEDEEQELYYDKFHWDYTSPELTNYIRTPDFSTYKQNVRNEGAHGLKSDIWSLGCVFLRLANCITGQHEKALCKAGRKVVIDATVETDRYISLLLSGYSHYISETIPDAIRYCIQDCLHRKVQRRMTAMQLLSRLNTVITEIRELELP